MPRLNVLVDQLATLAALLLASMPTDAATLDAKT